MDKIDVIINTAFGLCDEEISLPEAEFSPELAFLFNLDGPMDDSRRDYFSIAVDSTALEAGC
mgnify:FL=1